MYKQEMNATKNQLKEIDAQILEISSFLDYQRYLTPTNFASENQTFLECYNKGIQYNQELVIPEDITELEELPKELTIQKIVEEN